MIGTRQRFHYPDYGTPPNYPELVAHSGQMVKVVRVEFVSEDDADEIMYLVEFDDGERHHAWNYELGDEPGFRPHNPAFCGCEKEDHA